MAAPPPVSSPARLLLGPNPAEMWDASKTDYETMIMHALFYLEPTHPAGATSTDIAQTIQQFYENLPAQDVLIQNVDDALRIMRKKKSQFVGNETGNMFLYGGKMYEDFISFGGGGGLVTDGPAGPLPHMIEYPEMIVHGLHVLEAAHPNGATIDEIAYQIRYLYGRLPHSHNLQVQYWMPIMIRRVHVERRPGQRYQNVVDCKLLSNIRYQRGGIL